MMGVEYTGEFVVQGKTPDKLWREHVNRYTFASQRVQGKACLDVACGTGYGTALLARECNTVVGVDLNRQVLEYAQQRYGGDGVEFVLADARALPFRTGSFEDVVSFETVEHLGLPARFLTECRRVLRSGGLFMCSTPNRLVYSPSANSGNPFHVQEFSPPTFVALLKRYFADVTLYGQTHWRKGRLIRIGLGTLSFLPKGDFVAQMIRRLVTAVARSPRTSSTPAGSGMSGGDRYGVVPFKDGLIWTQGFLIAVGKKAGGEV